MFVLFFFTFFEKRKIEIKKKDVTHVVCICRLEHAKIKIYFTESIKI